MTTLSVSDVLKEKPSIKSLSISDVLKEKTSIKSLSISDVLKEKPSMFEIIRSKDYGLRPFAGGLPSGEVLKEEPISSKLAEDIGRAGFPKTGATVGTIAGTLLPETPLESAIFAYTGAMSEPLGKIASNLFTKLPEGMKKFLTKPISGFIKIVADDFKIGAPKPLQRFAEFFSPKEIPKIESGEMKIFPVKPESREPLEAAKLIENSPTLEDIVSPMKATQKAESNVLISKSIIEPSETLKLSDDVLYKIFDAPIPSKTPLFQKAIKEVGYSVRVPSRLFPEIANPVIKSFEARGNVLMNYGTIMSRWENVVPDIQDRRLIGFILDTFPADDLIHKNIDDVLIDSGLAKFLFPEQKQVIKQVAAAYRNLGFSAGLKAERFQKAYLTRLTEITEKGKNIIDNETLKTVLKEDFDPEEILGHFRIPKELFNRFFQKRKGGKIYDLDFLKAFEAYLYPTTRKAYMQPILKEIIPAYMNLKANNPDLAREVLTYINDVFGRIPNANYNLDRFSKGLVGLTYKGTLYGNISAGLTNATQFITNTIPEIGEKWTVIGLLHLKTNEGRKLFSQSGIILKPVELGAEFSKRIGLLDFMSQAEYLNRGITYLGTRAKMMAEGKTEQEAIELAKDMVRKTQFSISGADLPRVIRRHRILGQFSSFPIKQIELTAGWIKNNEWNKVARYLMYSYLLGGPKAIIPGYDELKEKLPEKERGWVDAFEKNSNIAGLTGIDLSQKFGIGIFPDYGLPPVPAAAGKIAELAKEIESGKRRTPEEFFKPVADILAPFIKGGVQIKKLFDIAKEIKKEGQYDEHGRLIRKTTTGESLRRIFGQPEARVKEQEDITEIAKREKEAGFEKRRIVDLFIDANDALQEGDEKEAERIRSQAKRRLSEWNSNPDKPKIKLDSEDIKEELKQKKMTRRMRQFLSLPKTQRGFERQKSISVSEVE